MFLRQSTAGQEIPLGPFVDSTDGNTQETGLTIANTDIKLWKEGATTEANKNSGGATHIASGRYYAVLDATDTNTIGNLRVTVHVAGALAVWLDCTVLHANVYDTLFGSVALSTYAGGAVASVTGAVGSVTGAVGSVTGDVGGKVLGGGGGTITGTGVRAVDGSGNAIAPAATALSTAQWTNTRAGNLDNLDAAVSSRMATFSLPTNFASLAITVGGAVTVGTNNDKSGYSLSQAFPTNFAALAITAGGAVTVGTNNDKTGYSLSGTQAFNNTGTWTGNVTGSVGSVTNAITLPSIPAGWITAAGIAAAALNGKGDWLTSASLPTNFGVLSINGSGQVALAALPSIPNNWITAAGINAGALNGKGDWVTAGNLPANFASLVITGAGAVTVGTLPTIPNNWITAAGVAAGALSGKGDWLTAGGYTAPDNTTITYLKNLAEADREIDTVPTPWAEVLKLRGTSTELLRKRLRDTAGTAITDDQTVIGSAKDV